MATGETCTVIEFKPNNSRAISKGKDQARRCRDDLHEELKKPTPSSPEWGTFLGPGPLARLDLGQVRASGAFARVIEVTPQLAYLQVSEDPADDLTGSRRSCRRRGVPWRRC